MQIFEPGDSQILHSQVGEYLRLLSELLLNSASNPGCSSIHDRLFAMYGEALCYRDELDGYLGSQESAMLNCEALTKYSAVFDSLRSNSGGLLPVDRSSGTILSNSALGLISHCLRTFGAGAEMPGPNKLCSWQRLQTAYFPTFGVETLRELYYRGMSDLTEYSPPSECFPRPWTLDEDYILVTEAEGFGINIHSLQSAFTGLGETRSLDEIRARLLTYFDIPVRRSKKTEKCKEMKEEPPDMGNDSSEWSMDDSLLAINLEP